MENYKISVDKEYFVEPIKNYKLTSYNNSVTGDLILIFGGGYCVVQATTVHSQLLKVMYGH